MVIGSSRYVTCHPYLENIGNRTILLGNWKDLLAAVSSWWEMNCFPGNVILIVPIGSMYGIYLPTCGLIFIVNVGKYHITGIRWDILIQPIFMDPSPFLVADSASVGLQSSPGSPKKFTSLPCHASQTVRRKGGSVGIPNRGASGLANGRTLWRFFQWGWSSLS